MDGEVRGAGDGGQRLHLFHRIDRPGLGRLGYGNGAGLNRVNVVLRGAFDGVRKRLRRQLAALATDQRQLAAANEELGPATFVDLDMRLSVAIDAAPDRAEASEGEGVGGGAGGDEMDAGVGRLKRFADGVAGAGRPRVVPIGHAIAIRRGGDRRQHFRRRARRIVGREPHQTIPSMILSSHSSSGTSYSGTVAP